MIDDAFDALTRSLANAPTRRGVLRGIATTLAMGLATARLPSSANAKQNKKKRKKHKKPKNNAFGCLDVGNACNGKDSKCCSGICNGKGPKKGKKDKSRCAAHNAGICQPGLDACLGVEVECGAEGFCFQTTGKAGFCAGGTGVCTFCQRDADCQSLGFGPGSACVVCAIACPETSGTVCFPPGA